MADFSQTNRPLRVTIGSVNPDEVLITRCAGTEGISRLYQYTLDLVAPVDTPLKFDDVLGQAAVVAIDETNGPTRFIHGIINRFSQGRRDQAFVHYRAELVPQLWLLTRQTRSRIFQQKPVKTILEEVIGKLYSPRFVLDGKYFGRNFCVQYRESDFAFISRVMEEEGIYYYFTHTAEGQELVISDSPRGHDEIPEDAKLLFLDTDGISPNEGRIRSWDKLQELKSTMAVLTDHNFELPANKLDITSIGVDRVKAGTVDHKMDLGGMGNAAIVEHPGGYGAWSDGVAPGGADRAGDLQNLFESNGRMGFVNIQQEMVGAVVVEGESTYRRLVPGHKFTLADHFDADGEYVLTGVEHAATCGVGDSGDPTSFAYTNRFKCIPSLVPFRPDRVTPRPTVKGTQTAVVVGDDPEIDPDKYGRVKVMFRWDPEGARGLETSCWVRVAQFWAGKQWGAQFIPRVGDEVVVAFHEGNPDQPIVIGSVYNADNMPMYTLPANKTQSGIKTHSSPGGDEENFNELRFEDKKGHEQIVIHAEKDMNTTVENNRTTFVGNNQSVTIGGGGAKADPRKNGTSTTKIFGDTSVTITKGNYNFDVQTGTSTTHVQSHVIEKYDDTQFTTIKNGRTAHITTGNDAVEVHSGHAVLKVDAGNRFVNITGFYQLVASDKVHLQAGTFCQILATDKILLKTGSSSIEMLSDGTINISGVNVTVTGTTSVKVNGGGDAKSEWAGGTITENGPSAVNVTGGTINLNS